MSMSKNLIEKSFHSFYINGFFFFCKKMKKDFQILNKRYNLYTLDNNFFFIGKP